MALDFPTATTVGQTYTDPTSGNTYVVTVVGPPAQWVGSGSSTSLDNTYLRKDASNDPVTGTLTVTPSTNVEGLVVTQPSGNSAAAMRITNEGSGNSLVVEDSANPDSTPFVIRGDGTTLIGTTSPRNNFFNTNFFTPILQVEGANTGNTGRFYSLTYGEDTVASPILILSKHRSNSPGGNAPVVSGDEAGQLSFQASDGTKFIETANIRAEVDGNPGANDMPGRLLFSTTADGLSTPTERMRITSDGYLRMAAATGGIQFNGDTAAVNALDDYEEGTWTPIISGAGLPSGGSTVWTRYVKIGTTVYLYYGQALPQNATYTVNQISNFPFPRRTSFGGEPYGDVGLIYMDNGAVYRNGLIRTISPSTAVPFLDNAASGISVTVPIGNVGAISIMLSYQTN